MSNRTKKKKTRLSLKATKMRKKNLLPNLVKKRNQLRRNLKIRSPKQRKLMKNKIMRTTGHLNIPNRSIYDVRNINDGG